eukprot:Blabericola_migrator_1__2116@NODE_1583_length_4234_cov_531_052556_g1035_i0_p4_GENE_NODE_1583_length_4234_cov_531_052556_g1035_i0NODE_1583_length_4234_cov_531_052556_g1035_i0_p4_ORF_typecomplete_len199_score38_70_NODE_1583_length_4234_cov_531_052556_g1035_i031073703
MLDLLVILEKRVESDCIRSKMIEIPRLLHQETDRQNLRDHILKVFRQFKAADLKSFCVSLFLDLDPSHNEVEKLMSLMTSDTQLTSGAQSSIFEGLDKDHSTKLLGFLVNQNLDLLTTCRLTVEAAVEADEDEHTQINRELSSNRPLAVVHLATRLLPNEMKTWHDDRSHTCDLSMTDSTEKLLGTSKMLHQIVTPSL